MWFLLIKAFMARSENFIFTQKAHKSRHVRCRPELGFEAHLESDINYLQVVKLFKFEKQATSHYSQSVETVSRAKLNMKTRLFLSYLKRSTRFKEKVSNLIGISCSSLFVPAFCRFIGVYAISFLQFV